MSASIPSTESTPITPQAVPPHPSLPQGATRRVAIDPLSRVEGHGKVTIWLNDDGEVVEARLHIVEFRGFEAFIVGRPYWEAPVVVQRLCGICPVSHHLAASKALDAIVGVAQLPPTAEKMRRVMHYGQILQSHALHFFYLAAPDLLLGFDADPKRRNVVGLALADPALARKGILVRQFGQRCIEATAGKRIHGTSSVPGGVHKNLTRYERTALLADAPQIRLWCEEAVALIERLFAEHARFYEQFGAFRAKTFSLTAADGTLDLYDGLLRVKDENDQILIDRFAPNRYEELITEAVQPWSYMKFPYLKAYGIPDGFYRVGPSARLLNCDRLTTAKAEAARQRFLAYDGGAAAHSTLGYHWARLIEMLHCAELLEILLADRELEGGELRAHGERQSRGIGMIEAPRGTLIHHYEVGDDDLITYCNLIVSTTHNNAVMNQAITSVAKTFLSGARLTEALLNHVEVAVRAFDPCLSCATHALGQMPLILSLHRQGTEEPLDLLIRNGDGRVERPTLPARP
ncbi:Ni/Fe hydrogenase subunit alpha [Hydrogenophilus islandicus]